MDLHIQLNQKLDQLDVSIKSLRVTGKEYAEAERAYKIAVNKKALELKDSNMPVTLIQTVIYGYQEIATLRFKRDSAEVIYRANQEAINSIKLQIRILESQIEREWSFLDKE